MQQCLQLHKVYPVDHYMLFTDGAVQASYLSTNRYLIFSHLIVQSKLYLGGWATYTYSDT